MAKAHYSAAAGVEIAQEPRSGRVAPDVAETRKPICRVFCLY